MELTESQIAELKLALKRCSQETVDAAFRFRTEGDLDAAQVVVYGIIERYMPVEAAPKLKTATDETRLIEDLGIDSLTMLEIVLSIEEALGVRIENDELREIRTLGEVKAFIANKITAGPAATEGTSEVKGSVKYDRERILSIIPQGPPFYFLDSAEIDGKVVRASYKITGEEYFLEGHFKDNPVFPASIVFEALGQAACLWLLERGQEEAGIQFGSHEVVFASMDGAHFYRRAKPGDVLEMEVSLNKLRQPLGIFHGSVKVSGHRMAQVEQLVLAYGEEASAHLTGLAESVGQAA
jgi:3-hydroxyacyl-[acyl-carrier-protein] dehydratase